MSSRQRSQHREPLLASPSFSRALPWMAVLSIIFVGAILRAPLTSVGPLIGTIREQLHISNTLAGMITTLPLLAFAVFSPFAPKLAQRFGVEKTVLAAVIALTAGIIVRSLAGELALFAGTALIGLAIAVCNVLLPSLIKREYPDKMGTMTGVYSVSMNLCGAIASGISFPIASGLGLGWQGALGVWAVLSIVSMLIWLPRVRYQQGQTATVKANASNSETSLWRSPLAWMITLFMGSQSIVFYVVIAWFPEMAGDQGISSDSAGWMLTYMQLAVLPFTFIVPVLAGRMSSQRPLVVLTASLLFIGALGLFYGNANYYLLWVILLGIGSGASFSLAMMFFGLRTRTPAQAAELSGMAQSVGYLLAAVGPTLFGFLHDMTSGWTAPTLILVVVTVLIFIVGLVAGSNRQIGA